MIGILDSGNGGLCVLDALTRALPTSDITYLGDHAHAPYADRPVADVRDLTRTGAQQLFEDGCDVVILACNAAADASLQPLRSQWLPRVWPGRRLLDAFDPIIDAIAATEERNGHCRSPTNGVGRPVTVGVFAPTRITFASVWRRQIKSRRPDLAVIQQQCPGLVALIEDAAPEFAIRDAVARFAANMVTRLGTAPDVVVLGCPHYARITHMFAEIFPTASAVLELPAEIAHSLTIFFNRHPEFGPKAGECGRVRYLTTGDEGQASLTAGRLLDASVIFASASH